MRRFVIALLLFTACHSSEESVWAPEDSWLQEHVEHWEVLAEGLLEPRGIAALNNEQWAIAERGAGRVLIVTSDAQIHVIADDLTGPWGVAVYDQGLLVSDRDAGQIIALNGSLDDGFQQRVIANDLSAPTELEVTDNWIYWLDEEEGSLWQSDLNQSNEVLSSMDKPTGISAHNEQIYVAESGTSDRVTIFQEGSSEGDTYSTTVDVPYDVIANDLGVFFTGRSLRWPYAGWLYGGDNGSVTTLCESPPGADRIESDGDYIYWSNYESILRCATTGGAFEMVAPETAVGDLTISAGRVTWTDRARGAVYRTP